jgi:hypothetical protein
MPTTTNYGWTTPADTDLVKDGAAAIRTLGSSVDTTVFTNASAATQKATLTTTGDIYYASSASTPARLGIGSTGQFLSVAGGIPSWSDAPSSTQNWTLVNTGGTAMSGSSGVTISGITGADKLMIVILQASSTGNLKVGVRINNDSTAKYNHSGGMVDVKASYNLDIFNIYSNGNGAFDNQIGAGYFSSNAASQMTSSIFIDGGNSAGIKPYKIFTGASANGSANARQVYSGGWYTGTSTISSIRVICDDDASNFDAGTLYVFKSA